MRFFTSDDLVALEVIYQRAKPDDSYMGRIMGQLGGVKRRARNRAIVEFCSHLQFEDISLTGMGHVMRALFGVAVSHADLLRWATPGRRADNRVDMDMLLKNISPDVMAAAAQLMQDLDAEWATARQVALARVAAVR